MSGLFRLISRQRFVSVSLRRELPLDAAAVLRMQGLAIDFLVVF
jgi:hypothetical protein